MMLIILAASQFWNILLAGLGTIVTGLCAWAVTAFTTWMSTKTKDVKFNNFVCRIMELTMNAVKETYQVYVEALKDKDIFDEKAQKEALEMCLIKIKSQCAPELLDFIGANFGDVTNYLKGLIESTLYNLKNNK